MERKLKEIRDQQRASWSRFSSGWKKWDDVIMQFLEPVRMEMINELQLKGTEFVLDVASGTGEPGLSIAARLPRGKVILSDLSGDMLEIAAANAALKGITNVETRTCDACTLPFEDNTFDALTCRFGIMFFPDVLLAAKEMHRVLKPGGRLVTAVWDVPEKNAWVTAIIEVIQRNMELPAGIPGGPGMFRCADEGYLVNFFMQSGFKNIQIGAVKGMLDIPSAELYWEMMTDVTAPVTAALAGADPARIAKMKYELYELLDLKFKNGNIRMASSTLLLSALKR